MSPGKSVEPTPRQPSRAPLLGLAAALAALCVADLARAAYGPSLRPAQWLAAAAALLGLVALLRARGLGRPDLAAAGILGLLLLPTLVEHGRQPASDGMHYYAWLRSAVFDRDIDLRNDYALIGWDDVEHRNVLPVGAPLLWSPPFAALYLLAQAARLAGAPAPDGVEPAFEAIACFASVLYGSAGLLLLLRTLRRWLTPEAALWTTLLCWVASPLRFYLSVLPSMAHNCEFFAAVLVLRAALALREAPSRSTGLRCGAACGLLFLVRPQDGVFLALPLAALAWAAARSGRLRDAAHAVAGVAAGFAALGLVQVAVWQAEFGVPFLLPHKTLHGDNFLLPAPELLGALISSRGGLFASHPALLLALPGVIVLGRRLPWYPLGVLPVLGADWLINASVYDWYHVRRFTGVVPLLAPGLGLVVERLARGGRVLMLALVFLAWRYDLAIDSLRSIQGDPAPVGSVVREASDGIARDGYALLAPAWPRAAVALLSSYTGEPLLEGVVSRIELGDDPSVLRLPVKAGFWSAPEWEDGRRCRWVQGRDATSLFLPIGWRGQIVVSLEVRPLETPRPMTMEVLWNGTGIGEAELQPAWETYRFRAPADAVRIGTNELGLRFDQAPVFRRVRGAGPRQVRPAAIGRISLHRETP